VELNLLDFAGVIESFDSVPRLAIRAKHLASTTVVVRYGEILISYARVMERRIQSIVLDGVMGMQLLRKGQVNPGKRFAQGRVHEGRRVD
jgi:hypothetical protein